MKIGIDLSAIQTPHRLRGIGVTVINLVNHLPEDVRKSHEFVLYLQEAGKENALKELNLSNLNYSIKYLQPRKVAAKKPPGRLGVVVTGVSQAINLLAYFLGDSRIKEPGLVDVFLQCDQSMPLPKRKGQKNVVIAYDIIPYVLAHEYLWNYSLTRTYGYSRKYALRQALKRWFYIKKLRINNRRADTILAISKQTSQDFIEHVRVSDNKISVVHLGVNPHSSGATDVKFANYKEGPWGFIKKAYSFTGDAPFLLFIGGVDKRRKIEDIVVAFNHLRAQGHELKLVLAGDSMKGPSEISNEAVREALVDSSYKEDIVFLGFVNNEQRDWLYAHALAYVFPSKYEGFGLPVVEAMSYGTPVICYKNNAVIEVAGDIPLYADSWLDIFEHIQNLLKTQHASSRKDVSMKKASIYTWDKTVVEVMSSMTELS